MALINCSECGKQVSDTAAVCPYCGCNIQKVLKKQAQELKNKQAIEDWNSAPQSSKIISTILSIVIIFFVLVLSYIFSIFRVRHILFLLTKVSLRYLQAIPYDALVVHVKCM